MKGRKQKFEILNCTQVKGKQSGLVTASDLLITQYEKSELDENHYRNHCPNPSTIIGYHMRRYCSIVSVVSLQYRCLHFKIAFNQVLSQIVFVNSILSTQIILEILLLKVVS